MSTERISSEQSNYIFHLIYQALKYGLIGALVAFAVIPAIFIVLCLLRFICPRVVTGSYAVLTRSFIREEEAGSCVIALQSFAANKETILAIPTLTVIGFIIGVIVYII
jgi:hypothetical protein